MIFRLIGRITAFNAPAAILTSLLWTSPAAAETCTVADPTGTPLNVRLSPRGDTIGTLANGENVQLRELRTFEGKSWAHVAGPADGWVFRNYLDCTSSAKLIAAPLSGAAFTLECSEENDWYRGESLIRKTPLDWVFTLDPILKTFRIKGSESEPIARITRHEYTLRESVQGYWKINRETSEISSFYRKDKDGLSMFGAGRCRRIPLETDEPKF